MFEKGKSGNPRGRPAGARNKASLMLDKLMEKGAQDIVETVIDRAKGGDMTAARLILERLAPPAKERPIAIALPPVCHVQGVVDAQALVIASLSSGELLPGEATAIMTMLEAQRKGIETVKLEARIKSLEENLNEL
ncbi:MAG: hypothetical protein JSS37_02625 [Proteobacteria bacterium]|nr:hypothetical protein [Pseudomonadota bacterium]